MNILVLTNVYPHKDDKNIDITKVVAYFAREWVSQGHNVVTVVNSTGFPKIYYSVGKVVENFVTSHYRISESPNAMWSNEFEFDDFGVKVYNMPMLKFIPKGKFFESTFKNQLVKIKKKLSEIGFVPDVITGHWANPQMRLVAELAEYYKAKSALVLHSDHKKELCERYGVNDYMNRIDHFGFRSKSALERAKNYLKFENEPFICSSGFPKHFLDFCIDIEKKDFSSDKIRLFTASRLVDCKNINSVISAADAALKNVDFEYVVAGDGPLMQPLKNQAEECGLSEKICFLGQIDRDEVQKIMAKSNVYVMISRETFGLVYIEAMLQGCIVIASRDCGIDGIVVDGENGFLCEEGNAEELADIFKKIITMSPDEKKRLAVNAVKTAKQYSEPDVARRYLENITQ